MGKNALICTVGLPRSGKSTWAKTYAKSLGAPIVNRDSIRLVLHGQRYIQEAEDMVLAIAKLMVKSLFLAGHSSVILDETNVSRKRRDSWRSDLWDMEFVTFDADAETCKKRAIETNQLDLIPVIDFMASQFEPVAEDEGVVLNVGRR